jgi:hypothetical protein
MAKMRAKLQISSIDQAKSEAGDCLSERLHMHAVSAKSYPADGSDEDNTFAKFSPSANFSITIANPNLFGQFNVGEKYYVDFTRAPE